MVGLLHSPFTSGDLSSDLIDIAGAAQSLVASLAAGITAIEYRHQAVWLAASVISMLRAGKQEATALRKVGVLA